MFFGEDHLVKILKDEVNLFEIPLFITFMKYAEAYPRTKRLATAKDYKKLVRDIEKRPWKTDPTTMVDYVDRETNVAFLLQDQFAYNFDKLVEMIVVAKESKKSMSAQYFAYKAEYDLWHFWTETKGYSPNTVFESLKLNVDITLEQLFEKPVFGWWIDYVEYLLTRPSKAGHKYWDALRDVFRSETNVLWLQNARKDEDTKELADRVWKLLIKEHLIETTSPKDFKWELMLLSDENDEKKWKGLLKKYFENEISAEDTKKELMKFPDNDDDMAALKEYTMKYIDRHEEVKWQERIKTIVKSYEGPRKEEEDKLKWKKWNTEQELEKKKMEEEATLKLEKEHGTEKKDEGEWKGESATAN